MEFSHSQHTNNSSHSCQLTRKNTNQMKSFSNDSKSLKRILKSFTKKNLEGGATFAVNKFADLSKEEFAEIYLMKDLPPYPEFETYNFTGPKDVPASFDWRTKGAVTPVKDQGMCGSCWAFSATENIESVYKLGGHSLPVCGPQQIVDCDRSNGGCGGGWPYKAYQYIINAGGQDSEVAYPYTARDGTCKFKTTGVVAKITGWKQLDKVEKNIQSNLVAISPFSVCVDASSWQFYSGGVMLASQCGRYVDHCTQLVGYDTTKSTNQVDYWIVRNSWGTDWGVNGIINLEMWKDACLITDYVTTTVSAQ